MSVGCFNIGYNGHLYVVGRDFWKKSCLTGRELHQWFDLSNRDEPRLAYYKLL